MKQTKLNIPYNWPGPIDETIKKKCLTNFIQKMSKNEILQKSCSICNIIGFNKDFKELKFLDLKNKELLQPTQQLFNIVQGVKICFKDVTINEVRHNEYTIDKILENNNELLPEVIVCEDEELKNISTNKNEIKTSIANIINHTNEKEREEQEQENNINTKSIKNESYFCYKNTILYKNGIHLQNKSMTDETIQYVIFVQSVSLH